MPVLRHSLASCHAVSVRSLLLRVHIAVCPAPKEHTAYIDENAVQTIARVPRTGPLCSIALSASARAGDLHSLVTCSLDSKRTNSVRAHPVSPASFPDPLRELRFQGRCHHRHKPRTTHKYRVPQRRRARVLRQLFTESIVCAVLALCVPRFGVT